MKEATGPLGLELEITDRQITTPRGEDINRFEFD
jgi:hypothetical protein